MDLHAEEIAVNWKTVARAMRRLGVEGRSPPFWVPVSTIPGKPTHSIPDRVTRLFDTGELNRVWMSDFLCRPRHKKSHATSFFVHPEILVAKQKNLEGTC